MRIREFPRPEDGLRAVAAHVPRAAALAEPWIAKIRPLATSIYNLRRRIATFTIMILAMLLFVHVMFGANGMVVYKQKRAEYESLQKQVQQVQQDNDHFTQKIQGLKTDQKAIEKEAREQLGYTRPGEYVYVAPTPAKPAPSVNHMTKK